MIKLDADLLLRAYAAGVFPMAESADSRDIFWVDPEERGILPLEAFHLSRRLRRTLRADPFEIRIDRDFRAVMGGCAMPTLMRPKTWINDELVHLYCDLYRRERAHSVGAWQDGELVGGLYGVTLGAVFFGESMFSRATDSSKVALAHLVARLKRGGFKLLDIQFVTPHLSQFGAIAVPRARYRRILAAGLARPARWSVEPISGADVIALLSGPCAEVTATA
ncbi:MAG: leucyl/phenylalanyl-tRNA--protein transferase [Stellaceae bacterium]